MIEPDTYDRNHNDNLYRFPTFTLSACFRFSAVQFLENGTSNLQIFAFNEQRANEKIFLHIFIFFSATTKDTGLKL